VLAVRVGQTGALGSGWAVGLGGHGGSSSGVPEGLFDSLAVRAFGVKTESDALDPLTGHPEPAVSGGASGHIEPDALAAPGTRFGRGVPGVPDLSELPAVLEAPGVLDVPGVPEVAGGSSGQTDPEALGDHDWLFGMKTGCCGAAPGGLASGGFVPDGLFDSFGGVAGCSVGRGREEVSNGVAAGAAGGVGAGAAGGVAAGTVGVVAGRDGEADPEALGGASALASAAHSGSSFAVFGMAGSAARHGKSRATV
jgi:hypothetical protein